MKCTMCRVSNEFVGGLCSNCAGPAIVRAKILWEARTDTRHDVCLFCKTGVLGNVYHPPVALFGTLCHWMCMTGWASAMAREMKDRRVRWEARQVAP